MTKSTETQISKTWWKRIQQDVIPEGQILQFCNAIMPLALGDRVGGKASNMTEPEAADIANQAEAQFRNGGFMLEERHTVKGYEWLKANGKRAGIPADVIDGFLYFRWVGTNKLGSGWQTKYLPVWEVTYMADGEKRHFEYSWEPYQARMYA